MTRIRRSFGRVKKAVASGDLAAVEKAVKGLGNGLGELEGAVLELEMGPDLE